jgi:hypothetical protein
LEKRSAVTCPALSSKRVDQAEVAQPPVMMIEWMGEVFPPVAAFFSFLAAKRASPSVFGSL